MEPLDEEEIRLLLSQASVGHVGLARDGQAYVLPVYFAYDGDHVWFHSHPGMKREFIASTKEACLTVTTIETEEVWASVQVLGPVEIVDLDPETRQAMASLIERPEPPTPDEGDGSPLFYWRLTPTRITGRKSVRPQEPDVFDVQ